MYTIDKSTKATGRPLYIHTSTSKLKSLIFLLKTLFSLGGDKVHDIPDELLKKLTFIFTFGFISIGLINTYFIYFTTFDTWVSFKFIGAPILLMLITAIPTVYLFSKAKITEKE